MLVASLTFFSFTAYAVLQDDFVSPLSFESPEGIWRQCHSPVFKQPSLLTKEAANLTPPPARLSFTTVRGDSQTVSRQDSLVEEGSDAIADASILSNGSMLTESFMLFNCHHNVHVHHNDGLDSEPLTYNSRGSEYPTAHDFHHLTRSADHLEVSAAPCCYAVVGGHGSVTCCHVSVGHWLFHGRDRRLRVL